MIKSLAPPLPPENASDDEFLLAFLDAHESPCPACGYNCHKIQNPRCPECGISLTLRVLAPLPVRKSRIALLVATAALAGMGSIILAYILFHGWPRLRPPYWLANLVFGYFIAMVPMPAVIIRFRRSLSKLRRPLRITLAIAAALWTCFMMWLLFKTG